MKVLVVTPSYLPIIGGSETLVRTLTTMLNTSGIHTDIMTFNMDEKWNPYHSGRIEQDDGFSVFKIPASNPFSLVSVSPLYDALRVNLLPLAGFAKRFRDYDLIHFFGESDLSLPIFSLSVKKPKIMHCVGVPGLVEQLRIRPYFRMMLVNVFRRLAELYIVFSPEEKKALSEMGVKPDSIMTLHYGIDTEIFRPDERKKQDNLILFVGRIDEVKGLHVLLRSLRYLDFKTHCVMIGPASKSGYFEEIKRMSDELNYEGKHRVEYLGGMNQHDLIQWYQKAAIMVRPDIIGSSGAGCSTLEALGCGTPVIGVQNHVIRDGVNGLIVPRNNAEQLAKAISKILKDKQLREKCGREGRGIIEQDFSWKSIIPRLTRAYQSLLNNYGLNKNA